jgi:hypothetical protein
MTKRTKRHGKKRDGLTLLLLSASAIATFGGARLLELQEPAAANAGSQSLTQSQPTEASFTAQQTSRISTIELQPIPQAAVPRFNPVARARSSM